MSAPLLIRHTAFAVLPVLAWSAGQMLPASSSDQWIRPQAVTDPLIWGRRDGIVFGIPSSGGLPGPRGLIRVGVIAPGTRKPRLVNFIAIEPVTLGPGTRADRMAFSELEPSRLDPGQRGKRLTVLTSESPEARRGVLRTLPSRSHPAEELTVPIEVETFSANRAHVFLHATISSAKPDELRLTAEPWPDSPPIEELTLTATMGNFEKLRVLWLRDRVVRSLELFSSYGGDNFVEHENYPLEEMLRPGGGDAIALATANEASPTAVFSREAAPHWHYPLERLTQYWRVPAHSIEPDLRIRVNGRRVYWASHDAIPGGAAFENFEVRERYRPGQSLIFGLTPREPWQFEPPIPHLPSGHFIDRPTTGNTP